MKPAPSSLRAARTRRGWTLREFAAAIPVSSATASRWETGTRRPHSSYIAIIAIVFDLSEGAVSGWFVGQPMLATESFARCVNVRAVREQRQLSRSALASELGVSTSTVAHWECGRRALPATRLHPLARVLQVPASDLAALLSAPPLPLRRSVSPLTVLRGRVNLTQTDVARLLGISSGTVSAWERGVRLPTWRQLRQLTTVYCCELREVSDALGVQLISPSDAADTRTTLARTIAAGRAWKGTSLRGTALELSVNWQTLRRWERGETRPNDDHMRRLEQVLGLRTGSLASTRGAAS